MSTPAQRRASLEAQTESRQEEIAAIVLAIIDETDPLEKYVLNEMCGMLNREQSADLRKLRELEGKST